MKPNEAAPLLASLAPVVAVAPPVLIVVAVGLGLYWLLSDDEGKSPQPQPAAPVLELPTEKPAELQMQSAAACKAAPRRITREDMAEALAYGERSMTRQEVVAALQDRFGKLGAEAIAQAFGLAVRNDIESGSVKQNDGWKCLRPKTERDVNL